ncbi:MAG: RiPP maturation radical SAM protein 1 [Deltaproteobacteria bacterium]|nr:RiPP maturation radical SAM protein 1 [Deltaproteobacteria bacterium]
MPLCEYRHPSVALGTLAAVLRRAGHQVDVHYLNLEATRHIGRRASDALISWTSWLEFVGEWLFAHPDVSPGAAPVPEFRQHLADSRARYAAQSYYPDWEPMLADLIEPRRGLRKAFDALLDEWARRDWRSYDVVGFTVNDQQLNASLRLGRRLKHDNPHVRVILGGVRVWGAMGQAILERQPWLDGVFSGYAERTFLDWVAELPVQTAQLIEDPRPDLPLDDIPVPAYEDYLSAVRRLRVARPSEISLHLVSARGCWWGRKHHCTFCGTDHVRVPVQSKSPSRLARELVELGRHDVGLLLADDMLDLRVLEKTRDELVAREHRHRRPMHAFVKANIRRTHMAALRQIGVTTVCAGIDSLSSQVLRCMNKGVDAVHNVWLLRACEEEDLTPYWNLLIGTPGEDPLEYERVEELLPSVSHLPPPSAISPLLTVRFSPIFRDPLRFGLRGVVPAKRYRLAFGPHSPDEAWLFEHRLGSGLRPEEYSARFIASVRRWQRLKWLGTGLRCEIVRLLDRKLLLDTRCLDEVGRSRARVRLVSDEEMAILEELESALPRDTLRARLGIPAASLDRLVDELTSLRLIAQIDGRLLRLAVIRTNPNVSHEVRRVLAAKLGALRDRTPETVNVRRAFAAEVRRWLARASGAG